MSARGMMNEETPQGLEYRLLDVPEHHVQMLVVGLNASEMRRAEVAASSGRRADARVISLAAPGRLGTSRRCVRLRNERTSSQTRARRRRQVWWKASREDARTNRQPDQIERFSALCRHAIALSCARSQRWLRGYGSAQLRHSSVGRDRQWTRAASEAPLEEYTVGRA